MEKKINLIIYTICGLAILWSIALIWQFFTPRLSLGITEQRKIYSFEPIIYLDNKPLPACSADIETRVCRFSCAPDGACVFIPREIIK